MHSMMAAWKDFLLFPVISYTKRLRKKLQTYVNIQNVGIFFLGYWEKRYKLVWTYKMLFIYLFMRQGAGVESMLGKRGIGILCSGVSGSCEPSDVDASSHTQVFWKTTSSPNYKFFPKPYFPFWFSFSVFLFCYWEIPITHIVVLGQIPTHSFNTSRFLKRITASFKIKFSHF